MHRRFITLLLYALSALLFVGYVLALVTAAQNKHSSQRQPVAIENHLVRLGHGVTGPDGQQIEGVDLSEDTPSAGPAISHE